MSAVSDSHLPRHRTLRSAIDWSYELLDGDERALFDRLGVFPADFDYEAVQSVCRAEDVGGGAAITLLPRLVDKSLVSTVGRGTRRYRLLETIRTYAADRLAAAGAEAAARQSHAAHYIALAEHAAQRLETSDQRIWLDQLAAEQPNLRASLAYSIDAGDIDAAWRSVAALQRFWDVTGQRREAHEWIQRTLALGDPPATPLAVAGLAAASAILHPLDSRAAFDLARQAEQLAAGLDDLTRAKAARAVGMSAIWVQPELVRPALQEALARFGDDHPWESALTMQGLASTSGALGEALQWGRDSVASFRSVGDQMYAANTLFIMAQSSIYAGIADDEVYGWLAESRSLAEAAGSEGDMLHATVGFGQLAWERGDHDGAAELMEECLPTLRRLGDRRCAGRALYMLGKRAHEKRQLARAAELLRASVEAVALAGQSFVLVRLSRASPPCSPRSAAPGAQPCSSAQRTPRATRRASTCDPSRQPTRSCAAPSCGTWAPRPSTPPTARGCDYRRPRRCGSPCGSPRSTNPTTPGWLACSCWSARLLTVRLPVLPKFVRFLAPRTVSQKRSRAFAQGTSHRGQGAGVSAVAQCAGGFGPFTPSTATAGTANALLTFAADGCSPVGARVDRRR